MAKPKPIADTIESLDPPEADEAPERFDADDRAARIAEARARAESVELPALVSVTCVDPTLHGYGVRRRTIPVGGSVDLTIDERRILVDLLLDTTIKVEIA